MDTNKSGREVRGEGGFKRAEAGSILFYFGTTKEELNEHAETMQKRRRAKRNFRNISPQPLRPHGVWKIINDDAI